MGKSEKTNEKFGQREFSRVFTFVKLFFQYAAISADIFDSF